MIKLFKKTATSFETNGIGLLTNYIFEPKVKEERNGYFTFNFKIPLHTKYGVQIAGEMIVTADCPGVGEQPFRITKVTPSMGILSVQANHIFYDLADNFIEDINIVASNGQKAGQHILDNTSFPHNFTFRSDLADNYNCRIVRYNPVEAFLDDSKDNTFVSRWGGEIKRDKYEIIMNNMRGTDRGVRISDRKNLTGYEADVDFETVVTRIVPLGYDGLMLPETYVDSPLLGQYTHPKIATVTYSQVKAQTESEPKEDELPIEEAYAELRRLAALEFSEHHVDEPKATYKINFVDLSKTTEYENFKTLEEILPWDWITVDHDEDNLHVRARLQAYTWDPLTKRYIDLTLGSVKSTVSGSMGKEVDYQDQIDQIREISDGAVISANGKNTNFYGLFGEDGLGEPTANRVGDIWFKPVDDEIVMKQWDGTIWKDIVDTATDKELTESIEEVGKEVDQAQSDSATALENANDAVNKANEASAKADQSVVASNQAKSDAADAARKAQSALDSAATALEGVDGVRTDLITEVTRIDGQLSTKVETTVFNSLKGTVTSQGTQINQNSNDIKLKANKTDVDTIAGRVTSVESQLTVQAGKITALNTLTDGHTSQIVNLTASYDGLSSTVSKVQTDVDGMSYENPNLLIDSDATSLTKVNAPYNRYFSDATNTQVTCEFVKVSDAPTPSGYVVQATSTGGHTNQLASRSLAWYNGGIISLEIGKTYTMSCYARLISGAGKLRFQYGASPYVNNFQDIRSTDWEQYSWTFVAEYADVRIYMPAGDASLAGIYQTCGFKLENGNRATPWNLANAELATVTQMSSLTQTVDSINLTVINNDTKTQSQITQLSDQITSTVTSSGNLLPSPNFSDRSVWRATAAGNGSIEIGCDELLIGGAKTIKTVTGSTMTYSMAYTGYMAESQLKLIGKKVSISAYVYIPESQDISQYPDTLYFELCGYPNTSTAANTSILRATIPKNDFIFGRWVRYSATGIIPPSISSGPITHYRFLMRVNNANVKGSGFVSYYGKPQVEISDITTSWGNGDGASTSQITQLNDAINLRVSKDDVINQINISPESILISGNKVHITGKTTIDSAVIKTAHIADAAITSAKIGSLSADKITTGTLNASNVNIINLNANNIVSGTLSAIDIVGTRITGSEINGSKITSNSQDFQSVLENGMMKWIRVADNVEYFRMYPENFTTSTSTISNIRFDMKQFGQGFKLGGYNGTSYLSFGDSGFAVDVTTSFLLRAKKDANNYFSLNVAANSDATFSQSNGGSNVLLTMSNGTVRISGGFAVGGSKSSLVKTDNYGERLLYAYETPEYLFATYGKAITNDEGIAEVVIEPKFLETINTNSKNYHVFVSPYDNSTAHACYLERDRFLIKTDKPNIEVSWQLVAYRKGYEDFYLETQESNSAKMPKIDLIEERISEE